MRRQLGDPQRIAPIYAESEGLREVSASSARASIVVHILPLVATMIISEREVVAGKQTIAIYGSQRPPKNVFINSSDCRG